MSEFLEKYLEKGLKNIVVISYDHSETASGHEERTTEIIVAKQDNKFVKVHAYEHLRFLGGPGAGFSMQQEEITEEEYSKLARGKEICDSQAALEALHDAEHRAARRQELRDEFLKTAPFCPKCGQKMVNRRGPRGEFWGCSNFPHCRGTTKFSAESRRRYQEYLSFM